MKTKAAPVLFRNVANRREILVFEHPIAGVQLIKGTVEPGESPATAAIRELAEEAGITTASWVSALGSWESSHEQQTWHFQQVHTPHALPESWHHHATDDGGHLFRLFWHELSAQPSPSWHPLHAEALVHLRGLVSQLSLQHSRANPQ
jgi:8-oxo-dGTP pyrophosphatase MutT (NUDIX family)